ncbi:Hypothetical_protein [Hexamita inflata]|uniref:Hypothetical_protein n=1 Tax=Hexamita inflata TaxID=28002 RepID=A0AA86QAP8_9EUKA|nr:Hypothetical protein HINF_LOCUS40212 [Hexamita inflata]
MIISFRHTYVRQVHIRSQGNQRLGYKHSGRNAAASCKPIYTAPAFIRKQWSGCRFPIMKARWDTARNKKRNRMNLSIDHTKQSWYSSNASSALALTAKPNRSNQIIQFSCRYDIQL